MGEREGVRLAGMGIVNENANFHSSETDSAREQKMPVWRKNQVFKEKRKQWFQHCTEYL